MRQSVKRNLLAAFRYLLRPLVRIAIRNGITYPQFAGMVQDAFVNVAVSRLRTERRDVTVDAISVMTEVGAAEVGALLNSDDDARISEAELTIGAATRILVGWHTDRDYVGPYGLVRDLQFSVSDAERRKEILSFEDLAQKYCPSYPPRALLDELVGTSCVKDLGNGFFRAQTRSYVPEQLSPANIRQFARVLHNMAETLELNLRATADESRRLERTVFADFGLPRKDLAGFDAYVRERAQIFADDVDNWLSDRSFEGQVDAVQTGVGFYHYVVNEEDERDFGETFKSEGVKDEN